MSLEQLFSNTQGLMFMEDGDNWGFHFETMRLFVFGYRTFYRITRTPTNPDPNYVFFWKCEDKEVDEIMSWTSNQSDIEELYKKWELGQLRS